MYMCECGEIFDEPKSRKEIIGEYQGAPAWDSFGVCPCCDSEEITEVNLCPITGEYKQVTEDYHDVAVNWGDEFWSYVCQSIQRRWDCDFKDAKEFLEYIVERNV